MVNGRRLKNRLSECARILCLVLIWTVLGAAAFPCLAEQAGADPAGQPRWIIHGPQIPPEGVPYDAWKGIRYSPDKEFNAKITWYLKRNESMSGDEFDRKLREKNYVQKEEMPVVQFRIVDLQAEAVGGEMKLRTGGYVDIVLTTRTSGELQYSFDAGADHTDVLDMLGIGKDDPLYDVYTVEMNDIATGIRFADPGFIPFDMYTGAKLLNTVISNNRGIYPGEAVDSGFVESHVSWKGRTYRLLARQDDRNLGGEWLRRIENGRYIVTINVRTESVYTFRIPADYDGLALCCPKTVYADDPNAEYEETEQTVHEVYMDILTENDGSEISLEDVWFIRVSDLLKQTETGAPE